MNRRLELDAARGLMLVWITLTHLPTVISTYSNQPFGFVSASEGFIMLAALFSGRNYLKLALRDGQKGGHAWSAALRVSRAAAMPCLWNFGAPRAERESAGPL